MARINITLPDNLLEQIDRVAREDYATRSEMIRQAVLFYMRFTAASGPSKADFAGLFKEMKRRQMQTYFNKTFKPGRKKH